MPLIWILSAVAAYFLLSKPAKQSGGILTIGPLKQVGLNVEKKQRPSTPLDMADTGMSTDYVSQLMYGTPRPDYVSVNNNATASITPRNFIAIGDGGAPNSDLGKTPSVEGYTS